MVISQLFYGIRITSTQTDVTKVFVNVFSDEDEIGKNCYNMKGYKATELTNEFQTNDGQKVALIGCSETPAQSTDSLVAKCPH